MADEFRIIESTTEPPDCFADLLQEIGAWLWDKGVKQWPPGVHPKKMEHIRHLVKDGCLVLAYQGDKLAGGCVLSETGPGLHAPSADAMYLSSLAVARFAAGKELGTRIIDACAEAVRKRGKSLIRLDCWDGNDFLKSYYQRQGFTMLEAVHQGDYAVRLFERACSYPSSF